MIEFLIDELDKSGRKIFNSLYKEKYLKNIKLWLSGEPGTLLNSVNVHFLSLLPVNVKVSQFSELLRGDSSLPEMLVNVYYYAYIGGTPFAFDTREIEEIKEFISQAESRFGINLAVPVLPNYFNDDFFKTLEVARLNIEDFMALKMRHPGANAAEQCHLLWVNVCELKQNKELNLKELRDYAHKLFREEPYMQDDIPDRVDPHLKAHDVLRSKVRKKLNELQFSEEQQNHLIFAFAHHFNLPRVSRLEREVVLGHILEVLEVHAHIKDFAADGNLFEHGGVPSNKITNELLFVMRWMAGMKMEEALKILKFDLSDSNLVREMATGNIGTAQRWAKSVVGSSITDDSEIMSGRFTQPPRIATFPATQSTKKIPITKRVDITSVCGHHFLPYGTLLKEGAYAIISYVPNEHVLGISKLQRLADWVSRRPTIQEDLARALYDKIKEAVQTEDVYIGIFNARHTCEYLRGSRSCDGSFTTEYYGGVFEEDSLRQTILSSIN